MPRGSKRSKALVLVGFMGAGKTSAGRIIARELDTEAIDTDQLIEQKFGKSIQDLFSEYGEEGFREREAEIVGDLLDNTNHGVISLGGGSLLSERVQEAVKRHVTVLINVTEHTAWRRASGKGRPLAKNRKRFRELFKERKELYEKHANVVIPHGGREAARRALPALQKLMTTKPQTRMIWAASKSGSYPVYLRRGLVSEGFAALSTPAICITDKTVKRKYVTDTSRYLGTCVVDPGEESKTVQTASDVLRKMAQAGLTRGGHVVAVGGGVVGDLAGFCAGTYQRGVPVVQVPTTVVAQVDSAFGGKTGVDLPEGKNYVGLYHQPAAVVVDPSVLDTLSHGERAAGYVEVIKTALISGQKLWDQVDGGADLTDDLIAGCIKTKLDVVSKDERDAGRRQVLNLGHTVGHAIETATEYKAYRHGEAVGLGLLVALRLSSQEALRGEVRELLEELKLPVTAKGLSAQEIVELTMKDKKRTGSHVPFVLVDSIGDVKTGCKVPNRELLKAVEEVVK